MKFNDRSEVDDIDINLTPLIDVVFLLLIFFMVSTTFDTTSQLKIQLPKASDSQTVKAQQTINLMIDARGHFFLNGREISSTKSDALSFALKPFINAIDKPILIQSDATSPVQSLVTAMDVVGKLGLTNVSIATTRLIE